jgi:hypothetical protein
MRRNIRLKGAGGALSLALLLAGCGTGTQAGSVKVNHPWRSIVIDNAGVNIQVKVPPSWPLDFMNYGAGDGIQVGTQQDDIVVVNGNPYHWYPPKPIVTMTYQKQFTIYKELPGNHNYIAVVVPNTATNRAIARKIIASVKDVKS